MADFLIVVDMQNDFIDMALGTREAVDIVPKVKKKIQEFDQNGGIVYFTRDTHETWYLETLEGRNLPVEHCIRGTKGWEIHPELEALCTTEPYDKETFGSVDLVNDLVALEDDMGIDSITLIGLCTDICVISNALLIKAHLPEVPVYVDASCCAGVTPESHKNALNAMAMCQVKILHGEA